MSKRVNYYSGYKNLTSTPRRHIKQKSETLIDPKNLFQNSTELKNNNFTYCNTARKPIQSDTLSVHQDQEEPVKKTPKDILLFLLKNTLGKSLVKLESSSKEQEDNLKVIGRHYLTFEKNIMSLKNGVERKKKEDAKKKKLTDKKRMNSTANLRSKTVTSNRRLQREYTTVNLGRNNKYNNLTLKTDSNFLKKKSNLLDTPKTRSKTMRSSKSTYSLKPKKSNDLMSTPKRSNMNNLGTNKTPRKSIKNSDKISIKDNDINSGRQTLRSKSKKRDSIASRNKRNSISRSGRKSISGKNKIKLTDDKNKVKDNINNFNTEIERGNSPIIIKKESENQIKDIGNTNNIITHRNENMKKGEESYNIKNVLKELEEYNEKKPKLEEEKDQNMGFKEKAKVRSRSKNRDKKGGESDKEIKASLIDVNHMIEGVSDVLDKIESDKKSKLDKRKNDSINNFGHDNNNEVTFNLKQSIKFGKESQIMNDEIINTITNDKNIMSNSIFESKIFLFNKNDSNENNDVLTSKILFPIPETDMDLINSQNKVSKNKALGSINNIKEIRHSNNDEDNNNIITKDHDIIDNNKEDKNIETDNINNNENKNNMNIDTKDNKDDKKDNINNEHLNNVNKDSKDNNDDKKNNIINEDNENTNNNKLIDIENNKENNDKNTKDNMNDNNNVVNNENNVNNSINNDKKDTMENLPDNNDIKKGKEDKVEEKENNDNQEEIKDEVEDDNKEKKEQIPDANQTSFLSQSSILSQSVILAEKFVLISRDPNAPFSIENTLKFDKTQCLGIIDFLDFEEKMQFTGISRGFVNERIYLLNTKREEIIKSMDLSSNETIDDLIMKVRLKHSNDELSKSFAKFQIARGGAKAVELLNNDLYAKLFKKPMLEKNVDDICTVYRVLLALFGEFKIATISGNQLFWIKCTEYLIGNANGKIGTFILKKMEDITFEHKKIYLVNKLLYKMKNKINANYFSKICGTTGLLIFVIRDVLEYCGVIINEKKTQPARILDNLQYYKNCNDTLANFINRLSSIKTYRIREKKE